MKCKEWPLKKVFLFAQENKVIAFGIACSIPVMAIGSVLILKEQTPTFSDIFDVHIRYSFLIFLDLLPVAFYLFWKLLKELNSRDDELCKQLKKQEELFNKYASWAETIGKGEVITYFNGAATASELGKSLYRLQENLIQQRKEEATKAWLIKGTEQISEILRVSQNIDELSTRVVACIVKYADFIQGAAYLYNDEKRVLENVAAYAYNRRKFINQEIAIGRGLVGQAAYERATIYRTEIPEEYVTIKSGILGDKKPSALLIVPLIADDKIQGVLEFTSLHNQIPADAIQLVEETSAHIGQSLFNLKSNQKTEKLLQETQQFTKELKRNDEVLQRSAEQMKKTQEELKISNQTLELKIREAENSEHRLHSILQNASEVITIYDKNGILKYESPSMKHVFGHSEHEIKMSGLFYNIGASGHPLLYEALRYVLNNPYKEKTVEFKYIKKSSDVLWLETTARNMLHDEALRGIIFNTRDITIHKLAEREQRMKGQMQALSENSPDMIVRLNQEGQFFYTNPVFEHFTGHKYKDVMKKFVEQIHLNPVISHFFIDVLQKANSSPERFEMEATFPSSQGDRIMHVNVIPELNEEKVFETVLIVAHDITIRKQIETEIKEKNRKINESINYARHLQVSILPNTQLIREYIPKSFIFYKPKDVVSGDFPWFFKKGDYLYIAAVDCTGHGVPGAMLSFVGYFTLNTILNQQADYTSGEILNQLHEQVRKTLKQDSPNATTRDGMDIALCRINLITRKLDFSGAHRPLVMLRNNEIIQYDADRKAIGGIPLRNKPEKPFTNTTIDLMEHDRVFFFSDGLPDQEGGPAGIKYNSNRIKEHILAFSNKEMEDLCLHFEKDFMDWKGAKSQMDDVLLIGLEF